MTRRTLPFVSTVAAMAIASAASAQQICTTDLVTDKLVSFSPVDGSLISADVIAVNTLIQVAAIGVGTEIWVTEQAGDRLVRYDHGGNIISVIGPTFPGGGFSNIRGMQIIGGQIYICNDGAGNGATADSLVVLDTSGNHVTTIALSDTSSPFGLMLHQGDLLVTSSSGANDVFRYSITGTPIGVFHNSTALNFAHQIAPASDGNVWCCGWSSDDINKLDATSGAILMAITGNEARGVYELQNGNVLWSGGDGVYVYDMVTQISTQVFAGDCYQLHEVATDVSFHKNYGAGCHDFTLDRSTLFQLFDTVPLAKAALDGNALSFTLTANGYVASWVPGGASAYVPPTVGATVIANVSTGTATFTPSAAIPVPGGATSTWTLSTEGILTAGSVGNEGTDTSPTLAETATSAGLAFYTWCTQNPTETSSGQFKWEEAGGVLYVTSDGVEYSGGSPTLAPSTYQWQINMSTGDVTMLWTSFSASNSTLDVLVGCTLAGTGVTPASQTLSATVADLIEPDFSLLVTLSASPPPVINPSTLCTYTIDNLPETAPGSGQYLSWVFLSVNPLQSGVDLAGIITTVPGCSLFLGSLDLGIGIAVTGVPTNNVQVTFSAPTFAPGDVIGAQAVAMFDPAFPLLNGEAGGFLLSNPVLTTTFLQ